MLPRHIECTGVIFMLGNILKVIFAVLAVFGAVELARLIILKMLRTNNPGDAYLVVSIRGHDEHAEAVLLGAVERANWAGGNVRVVCVDCGMDPPTREICEIVCYDHPGITLCTPENLLRHCSEKFANT